MADKPKGLYRLISLVFDSAASRKATREMEEALTRAGEVGGAGFQKELRKAYDKTIADAKVKLSQGLIDQKAFDRIKREADETFNRKLGGALQKLRAEGKLTDAEFVRLSKSLKKMGDDGDTHIGRMEQGFRRLVAFFAASYLVKKVLDFGKATVKAAADANDVWAHLAATVENTGAKFDRARLEAMSKRFEATTAYDDEAFATTLDRLIQLTGKYSLSLSNVGLVANVAAKYFHGDLAPAADLVGRVLTGQTRALREVGIVTKDAQEGYRILAERSMGAAGKAAEELGGQVKQMGAAWEDAKEEFGAAMIEGAKGPSVIQTLTQSVRDLSKWIRANRDDLADMAKGLLGVATAAVRAAADLRRTFDPAAAILGDNIAGIQAMEGFGTPGFAAFLSARLGTEQQQTPALQARLAQLMSRGTKDWAQINYTKAEIEANKRTIAWIIDEMGKLARGEGTGGGALPGKGQGPGATAGSDAKAREAQAAGEIAALENINALGLLNDQQRARAYAIQKALTAEMDREVAAAKAGKTVDYERLKIVTDRLEKVNKIAWFSPGGATPHLAPGSRVEGAPVPAKAATPIPGFWGPEDEAKEKKQAETFIAHLQQMQEVGMATARGLETGFTDLFTAIGEGSLKSANAMQFIAKSAAGIGASVVAGLVEGLAQVEEAKAAADLADAIWPPNPAALLAAGEHLAAAGLFHGIEAWAGGRARANFGSGGGATAIPSGATDVGGRIATNAQAPGPEINIYVDGFDPHNPTHQQMVGYSQQELRERWGNDARITYHARTG